MAAVTIYRWILLVSLVAIGAMAGAGLGVLANQAGWNDHTPEARAHPQFSDPHFVNGGGHAGGDALHLPQGDLLNLRNIQGGTLAYDPSDLNLDIGAGNEDNPARLGIGADVSGSIVFHVRRPGHPPKKMMEINPRGIYFYVKPKLRP